MGLINDDKRRIPAGLDMRLSMDQKATNHFVQLSEQERERLVAYVELSTTQEEVRKRVEEVVSKLSDDSDNTY